MLETAEGRYDAAPFLIALPMLENEAWDYAPTVMPKIQFTAVPVLPEPSAPVSPEPESSASPSPSGQPAASPTPSPGANEGLPQTGQLNWPIPLLALLGMLLAAAGCLLRRRHE